MLSPKKAKGLGYRHAHLWRNLSLCAVATVFWSDSHVQRTGRHGHFQTEQLVLEGAKFACIRSCKKSQNEVAILKDKFLQSILAKRRKSEGQCTLIQRGNKVPTSSCLRVTVSQSPVESLWAEHVPHSCCVNKGFLVNLGRNKG